MPTLQQLREELNRTESIKLITQALGDIATNEIKKTRQLVQQNIRYFDELSRVYQIVRVIASRDRSLKVNQSAKNGRSIAVALTSNYRFFGGLDFELMKFFVTNSSKYDCDRVVLGSAGQNIWRTFQLKKSITPLVFKQDFPDLDDLKVLSRMLSNYSKVYVYYSKFTTVLNQVPTLRDISETEDYQEVAKMKINVKYILEPEIAKMFEFFETEINILLLQAMFLEANIARTAARMISMNQSEDQAGKIIKLEQRQILMIKRQKQNRRIIDTYAGLIK